MSRTAFRTLGRSGLVVSPLALGAMTFGTKGWGASGSDSAGIMDAYVEAGGSFIDTADVYASGRSEEIVGAHVAERRLRDQVVIVTKFAFHDGAAGNVNAGGNGRKNIYRALEGSLRRLRTDYVDLYWLHAWDMVTPVEEVLQTFGDLVRSGKIRYFGFSNMPAWYAARAATLAAVHSIPAPIALQLEYSLAERSIEREHVPAARELGIGITPWSPLAGGFLAGKYRREEHRIGGEGRLSGNNPFGDSKFTERNWRILEVLRTVAAQMDRPMAQVALAWASSQPGVTSLILGASRIEQMRDNLASLEIKFTSEQLQILDECSAPEPTYPYPLFTAGINRDYIFGGGDVQGWR